MKIFRCDHCRHLLFFENVECVHCGRALAFLPDLGVIGSLDREKMGEWRSPLPRSGDRTYRLCRNYTSENVCNWAVDARDNHALCLSCRLTRVIPDLTKTKNREAWYKLESAKRRLVYTLLALNLRMASKADDRERGVAFEFLANPDDPKAPRVMTGHADGVITLNIAEVEDAERERVRQIFHEPYRTVLGHFRHEIGHYYWDRLVRDGGRIEAYRGQFGDERADYGKALGRHHSKGPPSDWPNRFVSSYASAHPWEDWAETWAHYMHVIDTLETAAACGLNLRPPQPGLQELPEFPEPAPGETVAFNEVMERWLPLTYVLNNLNRGLGLPDAYPLNLSPPAVEKLRFVHDTVGALRVGAVSTATASEPVTGAAAP